MDYFLNRLKEPTTWQGIVAALSGVGMFLSPEFGEAIAVAGVALFTLVSVAMKENQGYDT